MDMDLFQPDETPSQTGERTLICSCPKCSAKIEQSLSQVVEDATPRACPSCKTRYVLTRESFARRATRKRGDINCAMCGGVLEHYQYCPSCSAIYPDYFAVESPDEAKKRSRHNLDLLGGLKNFSFEWRSSKAPSIDYKPVILDSEPWQETTTSWRKKNILIGVSAVVIIAMILLGINAYSQAKARELYAESYIMALYGIKLGTDSSLKACDKISAEWAAKNSSGQSAPPQISIDEENQLNLVKDKTTVYFSKLNSPPSVYIESNEKLSKLNGLFLKLHSAALKPSGTITDFVNLTHKTESEFKEVSAELKKNLPVELSELLTIAKGKYSALKEF